MIDEHAGAGRGARRASPRSSSRRRDAHVSHAARARRPEARAPSPSTPTGSTRRELDTPAARDDRSTTRRRRPRSARPRPSCSRAPAWIVYQRRPRQRADGARRQGAQDRHDRRARRSATTRTRRPTCVDGVQLPERPKEDATGRSRSANKAYVDRGGREGAARRPDAQYLKLRPARRAGSCQVAISRSGAHQTSRGRARGRPRTCCEPDRASVASRIPASRARWRPRDRGGRVRQCERLERGQARGARERRETLVADHLVARQIEMDQPWRPHRIRRPSARLSVVSSLRGAIRRVIRSVVERASVSIWSSPIIAPVSLSSRSFGNDVAAASGRDRLLEAAAVREIETLDGAERGRAGERLVIVLGQRAAREAEPLDPVRAAARAAVRGRPGLSSIFQMLSSSIGSAAKIARRVREQVLRIDRQLLDEAAPVLPARALVLAARGSTPSCASSASAAIESSSSTHARIVGGELGARALQRDEVTARIAAVLEQVGVDRARLLVLGVREDRGEELALLCRRRHRFRCAALLRLLVRHAGRTYLVTRRARAPARCSATCCCRRDSLAPLPATANNWLVFHRDADDHVPAIGNAGA